VHLHGHFDASALWLAATATARLFPTTTAYRSRRSINAGDSEMRSATLSRIESPAAAIGNGYQRLHSAMRKLQQRMATVLRAKRDERYVMTREHDLNGPLANEYRRANWL
jgi:hypothetical protein